MRVMPLTREGAGREPTPNAQLWEGIEWDRFCALSRACRRFSPGFKNSNWQRPLFSAPCWFSFFFFPGRGWGRDVLWRQQQFFLQDLFPVGSGRNRLAAVAWETVGRRAALHLWDGGGTARALLWQLSCRRRRPFPCSCVWVARGWGAVAARTDGEA